jgi:hypothetical protein
MVQEIGNNKRRKKATYSDADIVLTYLWSVLHDRPHVDSRQFTLLQAHFQAKKEKKQRIAGSG